MSESASWQTIRKHLASHGAHIQRLEDQLSVGVPDATACLRRDFWLEGKFVKSLPARDDTPIRFGARAQTVHQRNWLDARTRAGGICFVWVRVADERWYYFTDDFAFLVDGIPKKEFLAHPNAFKYASDMVERIINVVKEKANV